jgi:hypothetical protein
MSERRRGALPDESFALLAYELSLVARDEAGAVERVEQLVARLETGVERDTGVPPRLDGIRISLATLRRRAEMAGRACRAMIAFAEREDEIRKLYPQDAIEAAK